MKSIATPTAPAGWEGKPNSRLHLPPAPKVG
jgi:hypothetical protein